VSLVVAMLQERPDGHPASEVTNASLNYLFAGENYAECLTLHFDQLPSTFLCQLQVKLRSFASIGGAWRHGCRLVVRGKRGAKDSHAIVYEKVKENSIVILTAGTGYTARSVAVTSLLSLLHKNHPTVVIKDFILSHEDCKGRAWDMEELEEGVHGTGYVEFKKTRIQVQSLELLFNKKLNEAGEKGSERGTEKENEKEAGGSFTIMESEVVKATGHGEGEGRRQSPAPGGDHKSCPGASSGSTSAFDCLPPSLAVLDSLLISARSLGTEDIDITISMQLQECIPDILHMLRVRKPAKFPLNSLWILTESSDGSDSKLAVFPFSPGISPNDRWFPVDAAAVPVDADPAGAESNEENAGAVAEGKDRAASIRGLNIGEGDIEFALRVSVTDLLRRTMEQLDILLPKGWGIAVLRDCSKYEVLASDFDSLLLFFFLSSSSSPMSLVGSQALICLFEFHQSHPLTTPSLSLFHLTLVLLSCPPPLPYTFLPPVLHCSVLHCTALRCSSGRLQESGVKALRDT
jgi:hypothetical protein